MIDKTINNIYIKKNTLQGFRGNTYNKNNKKILYKVSEGILTAKIANTKIYFFLSFLYIKGVRYKTWI